MENGIIPQTIIKEIKEPLKVNDDNLEVSYSGKLSKTEIEKRIKAFEKEMRLAAKNYDFEKAIELRETIVELRNKLKK